MNLFWELMFSGYREEADGGSGGGGGGGEGGGGGNNPPPPPGQQQQQLSLRAQLASQFEAPEDRTKFEEWANRHTTDKDFVKAVKSMRDTYDQRVPLPGADSKPEDWHKLYTRLGKPESKADYKIDFGEEKLSDVELGQVEAFKEFAFERNFTQQQFEEGVKFQRQLEMQTLEALSAQVDSFQNKAAETLRKEWGPDFEANLEYAKAAGQQFADNYDEYKALMDMTILGKDGGMRVGDHPALMKVMTKVGRLFAEDARIRNMETSGETESLQAKIRAIEEEARKAGRSTAEREYHERLEPLYKKLYPAKHKVSA